MPAEPTSTHRHAYVARINRVVDYIDTHIDQGLDLATLAEVAHFSPWHFHRLFLAMTGETLADCVRRHRLEAAARRLLSLPAQPVLAIALDVGFASAEVFARAFRAHFGMTPTAWRRRLARTVPGQPQPVAQDSSRRQQDASSRGAGPSR